MRIVRFVEPGSDRPAYGVEHADGSVTHSTGDPFAGPLGEDGVGNGEGGDGERCGGPLSDTGRVAEVGVRLAPVAPPAVLAIGMNYADHAREGGREPPERPVLFMKTPTAVQRPGGPIVLPRRLRSDAVDYEAELAVVLGRDCKNATRENALDHVLGYTCANDVSARDWQRRGGGGQFCRGKTFDTFAPLGPAIVTPDELPSPPGGGPLDLAIRCHVNGETLQDSRTGDLLFDVPTLLEFLSASVTLPAGTVILTGTPAGVGFARTPPRWLTPGDEVTVEIEGIGRLTNPVVEEEAEELTRWSFAEEPR